MTILSKRKESLCYDFCLTLIWTICICLYFSVYPSRGEWRVRCLLIANYACSWSVTCGEVDFVTTAMAVDHVSDKRTRLLASKSRWSGQNDRAVIQPPICPSRGMAYQRQGQLHFTSVTVTDGQEECTCYGSGLVGTDPNEKCTFAENKDSQEQASWVLMFICFTVSFQQKSILKTVFSNGSFLSLSEYWFSYGALIFLSFQIHQYFWSLTNETWLIRAMCRCIPLLSFLMWFKR